MWTLQIIYFCLLFTAIRNTVVLNRNITHIDEVDRSAQYLLFFELVWFCRYVRTSLGVAGYVLCIFSLLYGGFWRIKIRERYKLPATPWCCNQPNMSDCFQWLFCSFCSLCQEVRTAESYDVRNDRFFVRSINNKRAPTRTSGASSPDWGCAAAAAAAAEDPLTMAPLPSSPMVHIKDKDSSILQEKPVDLTAVFPPIVLSSPPPPPTTPHMAHNA